jgi:cytochrome c biogenesis protein CcmG, thiol:disulfide interchange protein DsbE
MNNMHLLCPRRVIADNRKVNFMSQFKYSVCSVSGMFAIILMLLVGFSNSTRAEKAPKSIAVIDSVLAGGAQLHGKVVYVDFWASWCVPCRKSFPWMASLKDKYDSLGLQIVTVNLDKEHAAATHFLDELKSPLAVVFDSTGSLANLYSLEAMPSSFIYDRSGKLRATNRGFTPKDAAAADSLVRSLLAEGQKK